MKHNLHLNILPIFSLQDSLTSYISRIHGVNLTPLEFKKLSTTAFHIYTHSNLMTFTILQGSYRGTECLRSTSSAHHPPHPAITCLPEISSALLSINRVSLLNSQSSIPASISKCCVCCFKMSLPLV